MAEGIVLEQIKTGCSYDLISLYEEYDSDDAERDSPFQYSISTSCDYLEPDVFRTSYELSSTSMSYFHLNCRGLSSNWDSFHDLICELHGETFTFDIIGISELRDVRVICVYHYLVVII